MKKVQDTVREGVRKDVRQNLTKCGLRTTYQQAEPLEGPLIDLGVNHNTFFSLSLTGIAQHFF